MLQSGYLPGAGFSSGLGAGAGAGAGAGCSVAAVGLDTGGTDVVPWLEAMAAVAKDTAIMVENIPA